MHAIFHHDYPLAVEPASTPRPLVPKKSLRDSLPIDMLLSALSFLVVAQSSSEVPEGLMNNPVQYSLMFCFPDLQEQTYSALSVSSVLLCLLSVTLQQRSLHLDLREQDQQNISQ